MALFQLFLCFCLCQAVPTLAEHTPKKCSPNQVTMINLENQYDVIISDLDLTITFDHLNVLGETSTQNVTELLVESADVIVSGHLYPKESYTGSKLERSFKIDSVIVRLSQQEDSDQQREKVSCKVVGRKHSSKKNAHSLSSLTPQERIEFVLHGLTESCLEIQICEQFNAMLNDASVIRGHYEQKSKKQIIPVRPRWIAAETIARRVQEETSLQNTINSLFDFGIGAGLTQLVDSKGIYHLPNIVQNFSAAGSTGDIATFDGTFEGLRSIKRIEDIIFSNNKNHYTVGTTVKLSNAKLNIPAYLARYGYLYFNGHVILNINGISLTIKVSVDYNSSPCKINLDEMSIYDVGNIDVEMSGLGWPLNSILESVIPHIIRLSVFDMVKEKAVEAASQLDCEKYRPSTEIMKDQNCGPRLFRKY